VQVAHAQEDVVPAERDRKSGEKDAEEERADLAGGRGRGGSRWIAAQSGSSGARGDADRVGRTLGVRWRVGASGEVASHAPGCGARRGRRLRCGVVERARTSSAAQGSEGLTIALASSSSSNLNVARSANGAKTATKGK
jgi:hypothetical protein